jgi:hypothetical protein
LKNALRDCFTAMLQQQVDCPEFVLKQLSGLYGRLANGSEFSFSI